MQCVQAKQAQELLFYGDAQRKGLVASQVRLLKAHTLNQMQSKWLVTLRDTFMDHHTKVLQTGIEWNYRNDNNMVKPGSGYPKLPRYLRPVGSDVSELS